MHRLDAGRPKKPFQSCEHVGRRAIAALATASQRLHPPSSLLLGNAMFSIDTDLRRARGRVVDFTPSQRRRWHATLFTDRHRVPADVRELVANAIAMHHTPGVGLESGAEAYLLSAGAAVDVFGLRSHEIPDAVRQSVIQQYPRLGFKREFAGLLRAEAKQVPRGRALYLHRFAMSADLSIRLAPFRD